MLAVGEILGYKDLIRRRRTTVLWKKSRRDLMFVRKVEDELKESHRDSMFLTVLLDQPVASKKSGKRKQLKNS